MPSSEHDTNIAAAADSNGSSKSRPISMRERLRSHFQKRVIIYNREEKSTEVVDDSPDCPSIVIATEYC